MSIQARICRIYTRPLPGADNIQLGTCDGHQVIVGKNIIDSHLGVFIPANAQVSHDFAFYNNLYRPGEGTNYDPSKTGYLHSNRRVKSLKMRGAISEGIFLDLDSLLWTGVDITSLKDGDSFETLNGKEILRRYETPAQQQAREKIANKQGKKKIRQVESHMFFKHHDTDNIRYCINSIPIGARIIITAKAHGTSGRTGCVLVEAELPPWKARLNSLFSRFGLSRFGFIPSLSWKKLSGTRNTVLNPDLPDSYHGGDFRTQIHNSLSPMKGETIYYEIVGWTGPQGSPIQHGPMLTDPKDPVKKDLRKQYGDHFDWSYGCKPGEFKVLVYRITHTTVDGEQIELSWDQIKARCRALGLEHVYEYFTAPIYGGNGEKLLEFLQQFMEGPDPLDNSHIKEGVCIRVEHPSMFGKIFKYKHPVFLYLEGVLRELPDYVDEEEIS